MPSALTLYLAPLRALLDDPGVTELSINRPGEVFVERARGWERVALPGANFEWCRQLARLVAGWSGQSVSPEQPLLSASLPTGERVQFVLPPATSANCVALSIRRPGDRRWALADLASEGLFEGCRTAGERAPPEQVRLAALLAAGDVAEFLRAAVRARQNIVVSGPTGSGKTTLTKALLQEIPRAERLITIEDAAELSLENHDNVVRLFYSKDGQGVARVTPKQLLEASLRLRPDRILLAELRSEEAYDYLRNVNSGHPGSITSVHASSARLAFEQLMLLVKESPAGRELAREDIHALLRQTVDVVVQCGREADGQRRVREVWYGGTNQMDGRGATSAAAVSPGR